jgi:hypothetical protein
MIMLRRGVSRRKRWHMYGRAGFADDFDDDVPSISTPRSWFSFASWIQSSVSRSGTGSWTERVSIRFDGTALCDFGFDSCANVHYVGNKKLLRNYRSHSGISVGGLGGSVQVRGIGELHLKIKCDDGSHIIVVVPDVLYIEGCDSCILSQHEFMSAFNDSISLKSSTHKTYLKVGQDKRIVPLRVWNSLQILSTTVLTESTSKKRPRRSANGLRGASNDVSDSSFMKCQLSAMPSSRSVDVSPDYAHIVLCHPSKRKMRNLRKHNLVRGISWDDKIEPSDCYPCGIGKSKLNNLRHSQLKYSKRGELLDCF